MEVTPRGAWHPHLNDPSGKRDKSRSAIAVNKARGISRSGGQTMVLDKGLGFSAYTDLIDTAGSYIDFIKLGFGTSSLYPPEVLKRKIDYAKLHGIIIMPGGTMLETAVHFGIAGQFFDTVCELGFTGIEVSDGTIELARKERTQLIKEGTARGLTVCSEIGKKEAGFELDPHFFAVTAEEDWLAGAKLVTAEARESGSVGLFDTSGSCKEGTFEELIRLLPDVDRIMWEAPLKQQQVYLINAIGADVHLGNISPGDVIALEAMRRGLRNDTFPRTNEWIESGSYMI